ncbi:MAG: phage/plasmid primase, P4 family [Nocardioidaceae bacterium]
MSDTAAWIPPNDPDHIPDCGTAYLVHQAAPVEVHRGQARLAYRLAKTYADKLMYVHGIGWHEWDGWRWIEDRHGAAKRAVLDELRRALAESLDDADLRKDVRKCESSTGVAGVLDLASALDEFAVTLDDLDSDPYLLNTESGTLDLRTGHLYAHRPSDRITKVTGCSYRNNCSGEVFERFLAEVLPDAAVRTFVQTVFGLALLGKVTEHVLPIFTGTGRNGKSTLLNVVRAALGDYAIEAEPDLLIERDRAHPTGLLDLRGTRLAVCQESDEGRRLAVATVKRLTGGDAIRARRMRSDFVEFIPSHTAVLVTNHKPRVPGDDPALWRRLRVVPFDVVVPDPDPHLPDRLDLERAAALAWAVQGYHRYAKDGLTAPEAVCAATEGYRTASDVLGRYLDERTITGGPALYARAGELFADWQAWCARTGERAGRANEFSQALEQRGFSRERRKIGYVYIGLGLTAREDG